MCITSGRVSDYNVRPLDVIQNHRDIRLTFVVRGPPRPQRRPQFTSRDGRARVYNPSSFQQREFTEAAKRGLGGGRFVYFKRGVPLKVRLIFYMPRPVSHFVSNVRTSTRLKEQFVGCEHLGKPDLDNLAKFVLDGLEGLAYEDDKQVIKITCRKTYDGEGDCTGRIFIDVKPNYIDLT